MTDTDRADEGKVSRYAIVSGWLADRLPEYAAPDDCDVCDMPIWCPMWWLYATLDAGGHVHFRCKWRVDKLRWRWPR